MLDQLEQLAEEEEQRAIAEAMLEQQMQAEALRSEQGGMQPNMNMAPQFMGGGGSSSGFGGGGALTDSGSANYAGGGDSSMMASAGPWAALAAVIAANEYSGRKAGRRADSKSEHLQDALTGKVLEQDTDYYGDKIGGAGGSVVKALGKMGHPEGQFNFMKKSTKNALTPWKIFQ